MFGSRYRELIWRRIFCERSTCTKRCATTYPDRIYVYAVDTGAWSTIDLGMSLLYATCAGVVTNASGQRRVYLGLSDGYALETGKALTTQRDGPISGTVTLDVQEAGIDWFDLKVILNVDDLVLTPEETKLLLNARGGYVRLGKKGWRRLQFNLTPEDDEQLARP